MRTLYRHFVMRVPARAEPVTDADHAALPELVGPIFTEEVRRATASEVGHPFFAITTIAIVVTCELERIDSLPYAPDCEAQGGCAECRRGRDWAKTYPDGVPRPPPCGRACLHRGAHASLAQSAEHPAFNRAVRGSLPRRGTTEGEPTMPTKVKELRQDDRGDRRQCVLCSPRAGVVTEDQLWAFVQAHPGQLPLRSQRR